MPDSVLLGEARDLYQRQQVFARLVDQLKRALDAHDGDPPTYTMRQLESATLLALADHDATRVLRGARKVG